MTQASRSCTFSSTKCLKDDKGLFKDYQEDEGEKLMPLAVAAVYNFTVKNFEFISSFPNPLSILHSLVINCNGQFRSLLKMYVDQHTKLQVYIKMRKFTMFIPPDCHIFD